MSLLFSYGSLQLDSVQLSTVGRRLTGWPDELLGGERTKVPIDDPQVAATLAKTHHDNVVFTGGDDARVAGMAFEIEDGDLAVFDGYEAEFAYERVTARLASGNEAWVYVHNPLPGRAP